LGISQSKIKIGFILPILNGGEHLLMLLPQIVNRGKVAIIEGADGLNDPSEHRNYLSVDKTRRIIKEFSTIIHCPLGKTSDPRNLLNKGLQLLNDADYFVILQQGDYFHDLERLLYELPIYDFIMTRKVTFWKDFEHYFIERKEIAFRNVGKLEYHDSIDRVQLPDGSDLKTIGYNGFSANSIVVNFRYITSAEKRKKIRMKETKLRRLFKNGLVAAKSTTLDHVQELQTKVVSKGSFLRGISHPWKDKEEDFFDRLSVFPSIDDPAGRKISRRQTRVLSPYDDGSLLRVLAWNCPDLKNKFESEGWEFSTDKSGKYDMICVVGEVPPRNEIKSLLKREGRLIVIDSPEIMTDPEFDLIFLEEKNNNYSFSLSRRWSY